MMNSIVLLFNNLITNYILLDFYHQRFCNDFNSAKNKAHYILYFSITTISVLVNSLDLSILNIVFYCLVTIFLTFIIYKQKANILIQNMLFLFSLILLEFIVFYAYTYLINYIFTMHNSSAANHIDTLVSTFVILIFYYLNRNIFWRMQFNNLSWQERTLLLIVPIFSLLICIIGSTLVRYVYLPSIGNMIFSMIAFVIILNIAVYEIVLSFSRYNHIKTEVALHKQQKEFMLLYYTEKEIQLRNMKHLNHDFVRHLNMLDSLLSKDKNVDAKNYISSITTNVNNLVKKSFSRNSLLDVLLQEKATIMIQEHITYTFDVLVSTLDWIEPFDLITIFSNLLDNAIDANENIVNNKFISLTFSIMGNRIMIEILNSCSNDKLYASQTQNSTKEGHKGYGLHNVINSVEKYDGIFDIDIIDYICKCCISFPVKQYNKHD